MDESSIPCSPEAGINWGWARIHTEARNSSWVSDIGGRHPSVWSTICCFAGLLAGSEPQVEAGIDSHHPSVDAGIPSGELNLLCHVFPF